MAQAKRPINAARAAKQAAHAAPDKTVEYRQAAAGVSRERAERLGKPERRSHGPIIAGTVLGIVLACVVVWAVGGAALRAFLSDGSVGETDETQTTAATDTTTSTETEDETETETATDANGSLEVMGYTYTLQAQDDGSYALAYQIAGSSAEALPLFEVTGEPVGMAVYEGFIYVVSNADGSYYVQNYLPGDGSVSGDVTSDTGTVTSVELDESTLQLTEEDGTVVTLELATSA